LVRESGSPIRVSVAGLGRKCCGPADWFWKAPACELVPSHPEVQRAEAWRVGAGSLNVTATGTVYTPAPGLAAPGADSAFPQRELTTYPMKRELIIALLMLPWAFACTKSSLHKPEKPTALPSS
jgi:hypothetical protein